MKYAVILSAALFVSGCVAQPQLPLQYATLRLIEKGEVQPETVIQKTDRIRDLMSTDGLTLSMMDQQVRDMLGYSDMLPSRRLIIDAMINDVTYGIGVDIDSPLSDANKLWIAERLNWIQAAAAMY